MATEEKFSRVKQLMDIGKEKGFVLYDEVSELLADDFPSGREFEDLLSDLDSAGVEILDPKLKTLEDNLPPPGLAPDSGSKPAGRTN